VFCPYLVLLLHIIRFVKKIMFLFPVSWVWDSINGHHIKNHLLNFNFFPQWTRIFKRSVWKIKNTFERVKICWV
jgi:hypothetical protein